MSSQVVYPNGDVDPSKDERPATYVPPSKRRHFDPDITVEEYFHYAKITRAEENANPIESKSTILDQVLRRKPKDQLQPRRPGSLSADGTEIDGAHSPDSKEEKEFPIEEDNKHGKTRKLSLKRDHIVISDDEWRDAQRALRTASWGAGFYLLTTDVLGPYGLGFAMGTLGWGPGIVLFTVFGAMAGYSGYLLWDCFMGLDSYEFPIRNYGDLAFRVWGTIPRYLINCLQSLLLILICGQVIILEGQSISQASKFKLCYVVCIIIFVVVGFAVGQVRTLRNFGMLSIVAVGLNLMVIFISMGVMAHSPPNYAISKLGSAGSAADPTTITPDANGNYPAIVHYNGLPDPSSLLGSINGLLQAVFAYGGAQIYPEIIAEMRRPWDFIKSVVASQIFIWAVYLIYGCYVYYFQGQYSFQPSFIGLSVYGFQVACDIMAVLAGLIAAALYGNIGIKVLYNNVLMELFRAPPITTKTGKLLYGAIVPIYWSIAFVIAAAIPDYFGFVSVISAFCVIPFTYAFPPNLHLAYAIHKNSVRDSEGFDAHSGVTHREDNGVKRWMRGFWSRHWYMNAWHVIYAGGAWAICGLSAYVAIQGMIDAFQDPQINAFTCTSPLNLNA